MYLSYFITSFWCLQSRSKPPSGLLGLRLHLRTDPLVLALTVTSGDLSGTSGTNESKSSPRHQHIGKKGGAVVRAIFG